MSPEQLAGSTLDRRSDQYSLALVVFHMLTGALPFAGETPEQVIYARFGESAARPLAAVRPSVSWPPGVQSVIDRALARDAAKRFDTAGDFAAAFSTAVGSPVSVPPEQTRPPRDVKKELLRFRQGGEAWFRRNARQVGRVTSIGLVAVLVIAAGARIADRWPGTKQPPAVDSIARRISAGEAGVNRGKGDSTKRQTQKQQSGPNDSNRVPDDGNPPPESTREDAAAIRAAAMRDLERLRNRLDPDSSVAESDARSAMRQLDALMPRLRNRSDSLLALLYKGHGYVHLDQFGEACATFRRIRDRAAGTKVEAVIEGYFGYGKC
jgi:hypothetical protein